MAVEYNKILLGGDIDSTVQAYSDALDDLHNVGVVPGDSRFLVGTGAGTLAWENAATAKASMGLGNVENTTLSTWAGTTNITTVGTIVNPSSHTQFTLDSSLANRVVNLNFFSNGVGKWIFSSRGTIDAPNDRMVLMNGIGGVVMTWLQDRKVGIGVNTPLGAFHVRDAATHTNLIIDSSAGNRVANLSFYSAGVGKWTLSSRGAIDAPNDRLVLYHSAGTSMVWTQTGFVGIGRAPLSTVDVSTAHAVSIERTITAESVVGVNRYGLGFKYYTDEGGTTFKNIVEYEGENVYESIRLKNYEVGIGIVPVTKLTVEGTLTLKERAAADGDTASYGQIWVDNSDPCRLRFTNDVGGDFYTVVSDAGTGGADSAGAGKQYVEMEIAGLVYKVLHDGTV